MSKMFFYDLETTGVRFWKHGIHQLSAIIVIDGEVKERIDLKMRPHPEADIDEEALSVSGKSLDDVMAYEMSHKQGYRALIEILGKYCDKFNKKDKFHLAGYNIAAFDNQFLRALFVQNGDDYFGSWFWPDPIDCYVLASYYFMPWRATFPNFQQRTVAFRLGIEVDEDKLHDGVYDVEVCYEMYKIMTDGKGRGTSEQNQRLSDKKGMARVQKSGDV